MPPSIYLVIPGWSGDPDNADESVVGSFSNGLHYIQVALELWRIAENEARAAEIEELLAPAFDRENRDLSTDEVRELDRLLDGLEEALHATVLDSRGKVPLDKLPELRRRAQLLDLEEREQHRADEGVAEASSQVYGLRQFLRQAIERGLHVALD